MKNEYEKLGSLKVDFSNIWFIKGQEGLELKLNDRFWLLFNDSDKIRGHIWKLNYTEMRWIKTERNINILKETLLSPEICRF